MARYIDADAFIRVLEAKADMAMGTPKEVFLSVAKMVDYLPHSDVAPKSEVAREIFEEIDQLFNLVCHMIGVEIISFPQYAELKKKYTEGQK